MLIRELKTETDVDELKQCIISVQDYERRLDPRMPPGKSIVEQYVVDMFEACEESEGKILVAVIDEKIAGYVLVLNKVRSDSLEDGNIEYGLVRDLVVLERYRGCGIGGALLAAAETEAKEASVKWLRIEVLSSNEVAKDMYLAKGYRPYTLQLEKKLP